MEYFPPSTSTRASGALDRQVAHARILNHQQIDADQPLHQLLARTGCVGLTAAGLIATCPRLDARSRIVLLPCRRRQGTDPTDQLRKVRTTPRVVLSLPLSM